ncbi:hypothetical protein J4218_06185 [Candidatus Pacearchaeota archaeon]|nr:hypothetical protein [Candidatus Pacearchaeota archaeon]
MTTEPQKQEQVAEAIRQKGTPLYVYDLSVVEENFRRINDTIPYPRKRIYYAMMANASEGVLDRIARLGGGVQVNSIHELKSARQRFDTDRISFTSTGLSRETLSRLIVQRVQVNLDSVEEGLKFLSLPTYRNQFGVRLRMPRVYFNGRFTESDTGIKESDLEIALINAGNKGVRVNGIHGYCGSNIFDAEFLKKSADYIADCASRLHDLEYVNFGGGFGVPVHPEQTPLDLNEVLGYYAELTKKLSQYNGREIELRIEPGRALVATAGTLYTRITNVKQLHRSDGKVQVAVNAGFGEFARPRLYETYHEVFALGREGNTMYCDVRGNTVLQDDYLAKDIRLPEVKEGDILGIRNVGAYGMAMASGFPGKELPKEVCIE